MLAFRIRGKIITTAVCCIVFSIVLNISHSAHCSADLSGLGLTLLGSVHVRRLRFASEIMVLYKCVLYLLLLVWLFLCRNELCCWTTRNICLI